MQNLLLFLFPSLTSWSAFLGWKILLINPKRLEDFTDGCGLSAPIHFALLFNYTYFLFPRKFFFLCFLFFFNLDISTDLGKGLFFLCVLNVIWRLGGGSARAQEEGFIICLSLGPGKVV